MSTQYGGIPSNVTVPAAVNIQSSTNAAPIVIQTATPHGMLTGDVGTVTSHATNWAANGTWTVTVIDATHVSLNTSAGNGVGAATGQLQPMSEGASYQIPSDGDARSAASINVGLSALGDRTAFLAANTGTYRPILPFVYQKDDSASGTPENTNWLGASFTAFVTNTWTPITGSSLATNIIPAPGILQQNDLIDVTFTGTASAADSNGHNIGIVLGLGVGYATAGISPLIFAIIPGSGVAVIGSGSNSISNPRVAITLHTYLFIPSQTQTVRFNLFGFTRDATPGGLSLSMLGDYTLTGMVWRPTAYSGRVG